MKILFGCKTIEREAGVTGRETWNVVIISLSFFSCLRLILRYKISKAASIKKRDSGSPPSPASTPSSSCPRFWRHGSSKFWASKYPCWYLGYHTFCTRAATFIRRLLPYCQRLYCWGWYQDQCGRPKVCSYPPMPTRRLKGIRLIRMQPSVVWMEFSLPFTNWLKSRGIWCRL